VTVLCSRCKVDQPPENFSPKLWIVTSHFNAKLQEVRTVHRCRRGRSYHCKTCRNEYAKRKGLAGKVSAKSVQAQPISGRGVSDDRRY